MKRKIAIYSILAIIVVAAWWSLPAWLSQPGNDWTVTPTPSEIRAEGTRAPADAPAADISKQPAAETEPLNEIAPMENVSSEKATNRIDSDLVEPTFEPSFVPQSGELEFRVRNKVQGRERYTVTRSEEGGWQVDAKGKFYFEIAYIPLELDYRQMLKLNDELAPIQYKTQLRGPLGLGNSDTLIDFSPEQAVMVSNGQETIIPLETHDMLAINMFATFSLLTQWFEVGQPEATFMALDAGGFEDDANLSEGGYRLGEMRLVRLDDIPVQIGEGQIVAKRYVIRIDGPQDGFQVLFYEGQWIGMWGKATDDGGGYFTIYRTDLFSNDFQVLTEDL